MQEQSNTNPWQGNPENQFEGPTPSEQMANVHDQFEAITNILKETTNKLADQLTQTCKDRGVPHTTRVDSILMATKILNVSGPQIALNMALDEIKNSQNTEDFASNLRNLPKILQAKAELEEQMEAQIKAAKS